MTHYADLREEDHVKYYAAVEARHKKAVSLLGYLIITNSQNNVLPVDRGVTMGDFLRTAVRNQMIRKGVEIITLLEVIS